MTIRKTVTVRRSVEVTFESFTTHIGKWWPLTSHSVGQSSAATLAFEGRVGGRLIERTPDGREHVWGTLRVWSPPSTLVFSWHPGRDESTAQEVEVSFEAVEGGTRVSLEHRGWGEGGERSSYDSGWDEVFGVRFATWAQAA